MSCQQFANTAGAYSLGALDDADLEAYEAHLRTCAECSARVEQLRPTVRMLAAARAAGFDDPIPGPVPDTVLPGLLRRAERERARRRWVTRAVAGVAAACLVALGVTVWPRSPTPLPAPRALVAVRTNPIKVEATARLVPEPWGTEVTVRCAHERYAEARGVRYGLRIIDRDRHAYELGTWAVNSDRPIFFTGGTAVRRERIARVQITLPDGTPILQLTL